MERTQTHAHESINMGLEKKENTWVFWELKELKWHMMCGVGICPKLIQLPRRPSAHSKHRLIMALQSHTNFSLIWPNVLLFEEKMEFNLFGLHGLKAQTQLSAMVPSERQRWWWFLVIHGQLSLRKKALQLFCLSKVLILLQLPFFPLWN